METVPTPQPAGRLVAVIAALAALDQGCKAIVRATLAPGDEVGVAGEVLSIVGVRNYRGVSWWVPDPPPWGLAALIAAFVLILVMAVPLYRFHCRYRRTSSWAAAAATLLAAAAAGHVLDGLFAPYTTDWLRLFRLPAFNLADLYGFAGLACLAVELRWARAQARGLSFGERLARARASRREFLRFMWDGLRRR